MGHGLGLTRRCGLREYATAFAAAGYVVLAFDYRGFGDSEGSPRQLVCHRKQQEDWAAAIEFARARPEVDADRVVTWGFSLGGGHALTTAAGDPRVAAVVAIAPMFSAVSSTMNAMRRWRLPVFVSTIARAIADQIGSWLGRPAQMVPLAAKPGELGLLTSPDAYRGYRAISPEDFDFMTCARTVLTFWTYLPGRRLRGFTRPILVFTSSIDTINPPGPTIRSAKTCSHASVVELECDHMAFLQEPQRTLVVEETLEFLRERLAWQLEEPERLEVSAVRLDHRPSEADPG